MMNLLVKLLDIFERLFGKILDDIGCRSYNKWISFVNRKNLFQQLLELPYVRYGVGECYYGKCHDLNSREVLMQIKEYKYFFLKTNYFSRKIMARKLIDEYQINSYDDSDKFFISLVVLIDVLTKNDITNLYEKYKEDTQAADLLDFLKQVSINKPKLIDDYIVNAISNKMVS